MPEAVLLGEVGDSVMCTLRMWTLERHLIGLTDYRCVQNGHQIPRVKGEDTVDWANGVPLL